MARELGCPNGCADTLFEALNAPMWVDGAGRYVRHDATSAAFRCATCGSIAVDLSEAARAMTEGDAPEAPLTCPSCGILMLPPDDEPFATTLECPLCAAQFSPEEGMPRLHGGSWAENGGE